MKHTTSQRHGVTLYATLRKDRTILGTLDARQNDLRIGGPWECYGKSDNAKAAASGNPKRNPLKKFGDTPTGTYTATIGPAQANTRTYGVHPVILLAAKAGQCVRAVRDGKRAGLWLHGGALNAAGKLRPTHGCLRGHDETMAEIHELIKEFGPLTEVIVTEEQEHVS